MATKRPVSTVKRAPVKPPVGAEPDNLFEPPNDALTLPTLKVRKLHPKATLPTYGTNGAACFDIVTTDTAVLWPGKAKIFDTGLSVEVPEGHVMIVYSRSGHGFKHGLRLGNCTGVIDSDYRGELKIALRNDGTESVKIYAGDRIAQAMIVPVQQYAIVEAEQLSETERGDGGFGSTGR